MYINFIATCPVCGKELKGKLLARKFFPSTIDLEVDEMDDRCDFHMDPIIADEEAERMKGI